MAKKVTAIICGVSWALFLIPLLFMEHSTLFNSPLAAVWAVSVYLAIFSIPVLIIMGIIDYARRPR